MAATLTTSNELGMGYQRGYFSGSPEAPLNMTFFDAAFAGHINQNKIYKKAYHCDIIGRCGLMEWLDGFMGYDTDCFTAYTLLETYGRKRFVTVESNVTVDNYPNDTVIELEPEDTYTLNAYFLPQVGNTVVLPNGELLKVISIGTASALDPKITVRARNPNFTDYALLAGDQLLILTGSEILDCACPTGQFTVPDKPIEIDLSMYNFADKGSICGDAFDTCKWLKIPFYDECGNNIGDAWYTDALERMYRDHEDHKFYERLLNPSFGIIPQVKARGIKWTPNNPAEIVEEDFRVWKKELDKVGIMCKEFAIFAGRDLFSLFQKAFKAIGVGVLQYSERPLNDCAWINLEYCGIRVEGLTIHVYEECHFSNGKELGGPSSVFPSSAVIVPMCNRPACTRTSGRTDAGRQDEKMLSMVYFRSKATGQVFDNMTDSNGIFGPRNTFGTGCRQHEWTIQSRFLQEVHCANWWGFMGTL